MKSYPFKQLLKCLCFFCGALALWFIPWVRTYLDGCSYNWPTWYTLSYDLNLFAHHHTNSINIVSWIGLAIFWGLAGFYGMLSIAAIIDLFNPRFFMPKALSDSNRQFSIAAKKNLHQGALTIAATVAVLTCLLTGLIFCIKSFGSSYSSSDSYWPKFEATQRTAARVLGENTIFNWCLLFAQQAWMKGDYSASRKFCNLALAHYFSKDFYKPQCSICQEQYRIQLANIYWKTGQYDKAADLFKGLCWHTTFQGRDTIMYCSPYPAILDLRKTKTEPLVALEFNAFRDYLDKSDKGKTNCTFAEYKAWSRFGKHGDARNRCQRELSFFENSVVVIDQNSYDKLCQTSGLRCEQLNLTDSATKTANWVPANWVAKLRNESI